MGRFITTNGSYFDPLSYEELIRPIETYQKKYDETQDAYDQMAMQTSALERYLSQDENRDVEAKRLYNDYMDKLDKAQRSLYDYGLTPDTRKNLRAARVGFASDINRLGKAIEDRQKRSEEYRTARRSNPNLVAAPDPGNADLDAYLADERYGSNWWSYDSAEFEKEVAADAMARTREMLSDLSDPNSVIKNNALKNALKQVLTRVTRTGFTSGEIDLAETIADDIVDMTPVQKNKYYNKLRSGATDEGDAARLEGVILLADSFIDRYDATGVRDSGADPEEMVRLFTRGKKGLAQAIGPWDVKDFEMPLMTGSGSGGGTRRGAGNIDELLIEPEKNDTHSTVESQEELSGKVKRDVALAITGKSSWLGITDTPDDNAVMKSAEASDYVYCGDLRRKAYDKVGVDIGRDFDRTDVNQWVTGLLTNPKNGETHEIRVNPHEYRNGIKGFVQYKDSNGKWIMAPDLTQYYHEYRDRYLAESKEHMEEYKKNGGANPGLDPDSQHELYTKYDIAPMTGIADAYNMIMEKYPENLKINRTYIFQSGQDKGKYSELLLGNIDLPLKYNRKNNTDHIVGVDKKAYKESRPKKNDGQATGLHYLVSGVPGESVDPDDINDILRFDNDGNLSNIRSVTLDKNAIVNGYMIVETKGGEMLTIGLDMFKSDELKGLFDQGRRELKEIMYNNTINEEEKKQKYREVVNTTVNLIRQEYGFDKVTQSVSGTASKK